MWLQRDKNIKFVKDNFNLFYIKYLYINDELSSSPQIDAEKNEIHIFEKKFIPEKLVMIWYVHYILAGQYIFF